MNKIMLIIGVVAVVLIVIFLGQNSGVFAPTNNPVGNNNKPILPGSKSLDISNQGLEKIPSYVFSQTSLEEMNVSHNQLNGAIQAEIRQLGNLKILNASYNNMTGVPAEIGQLQKLEVLDLSYNKLTGLPNELGNLKN